MNFNYCTMITIIKNGIKTNKIVCNIHNCYHEEASVLGSSKKLRNIKINNKKSKL